MRGATVVRDLRKIASLEGQLAVADARSVNVAHARELVRSAAEMSSPAEIEEQRTLAKTVTVACGGLVVSVDGRLRLANGLL
jgi:hypothetical protein